MKSAPPPRSRPARALTLDPRPELDLALDAPFDAALTQLDAFAATALLDRLERAILERPPRVQPWQVAVAHVLDANGRVRWTIHHAGVAHERARIVIVIPGRGGRTWSRWYVGPRVPRVRMTVPGSTTKRGAA